MQATADTAPHFQEITRALQDKIGKDLDEEDLKAEFQKYLDYGVPPEQAVKTILRHQGVQGTAAPAAANTNERTKLSDLQGGVPYANVLVRVLSLNTKTVKARGEDKEIFWGMFGDETASRAYTSWRPLEGIEKGDVLAIAGVYTKEWRGEVQINLGDRCKIEKRADEDLPKAPETMREVTVAQLQPGDRGLKVTGRVLEIGTRDVTVQDEQKTIWTGTLADETGKVEFTAWADPGLEAGQAVTIEGGYVRAFRGTPQFTFDDDAKVTPADADLPEADELATATATRLCDVHETGGNDIEVVATLLEVRDGSGLVFRDPETNRVVQGSHIKDNSVPDLRIKGVLDDGTAAVSVIVGRELTESLLGKTLEECQATAKEAFRSEIIQEQLQEKLAGRLFRVRGNVLVDEYGAMFIARSFDTFEASPEKEAEALMAQLEDN